VYKAVLKGAASDRVRDGGDAPSAQKNNNVIARDSALLSEDARKIVFGIIKDEEIDENSRNNNQYALFEQIKARFPQLMVIEQFLKDCYQVFDSKDIGALDMFILKYKESSIEAISQYAVGLQADYEAVKNSLIYPNVSNGPLEGLNSRIKMIHRRSGGRAGMLLLNAYMLLS
jgi:transposase